jgi:hypothetical protein
MNLAARLADVAQRHEIVVTAAVKNEAAGVPGVEFVPLGRRALKGIAEEIDVFATVAQGAQGPRSAGWIQYAESRCDQAQQWRDWSSMARNRSSAARRAYSASSRRQSAIVRWLRQRTR